jgi:hypothetical protein
MLVNRVGTFFILLGLMLIVLFVYSDLVDAPVCSMLIYGGVSLALGVFLWFRNPAPPSQPTGRFRIFKSRGKKDEKKK